MGLTVLLFAAALLFVMRVASRAVRLRVHDEKLAARLAAKAMLGAVVVFMGIFLVYFTLGSAIKDELFEKVHLIWDLALVKVSSTALVRGILAKVGIVLVPAAIAGIIVHEWIVGSPLRVNWKVARGIVGVAGASGIVFVLAGLIRPLARLVGDDNVGGGVLLLLTAIFFYRCERRWRAASRLSCSPSTDRDSLPSTMLESGPRLSAPEPGNQAESAREAVDANGGETRVPPG